MCSKGQFGCGTLKTDKVKWNIINLGLTFLIISEGVDTIEHSRLFCKDLGILDEILPLDRVQLLEVF